ARSAGEQIVSAAGKKPVVTGVAFDGIGGGAVVELVVSAPADQGRGLGDVDYKAIGAAEAHQAKALYMRGRKLCDAIVHAGNDLALAQVDRDRVGFGIPEDLKRALAGDPREVSGKVSPEFKRFEQRPQRIVPHSETTIHRE